MVLFSIIILTRFRIKGIILSLGYNNKIIIKQKFPSVKVYIIKIFLPDSFTTIGYNKKIRIL